MHRSQKPLSQALILTMIIAPLLSSAPVRAEESTATTVLQGMQGALNGTNTLLTTIQSSNAQMQQLYGQFTNLNSQQAAVQTGLGALDQTKQELSLALATAQTCLANADSKKTAKAGRYKKATITNATNLTNAEPTCENYGTIIDSGRKLSDQIAASMEKTACMMQLQNSLGQVANKSKTAFTQAQQAATEVYNTRTSIITNYENMAKRIDGDLNGKDGQGGYKKQLADLKALSADLYAKVNSGLNLKDNKAEGGGFAARLRMAKASRTQAANTWYKRFLLGDSNGPGDVQQCFNSMPTTCRSGQADSPMNCIASALSSGTGTGAGFSGRVSAVQRALGAANATALGRTLGMNVAAQVDANRLAALDVKNQDEFLTYTRGQFDKMVSKVLNNFRAQTFYGNNVNKSELTNFIKEKYEECYNSAVSNFKSDLAGEGGQYKAALRSVEESEAGLNAEIKSTLDAAQAQMNDFRTSFNKIYNSDLPQFSSDCSASDDPYQSLDCLRMLSANLKSGVEGTSQTVKLDTKLAATGLKQFTAQPPATVMTLQNLTIDPNSGKPTLGSTTTSCVGFNECVNVMDRTLTHYNDQKTSQETARKDFVDTHNKSIQTSLGTISAQFTQVGTLFGQEVEKLNKELLATGLSATLKTKQVEGEALVANEKTGLYDTPKDMKAAIASQGAFTELDGPEETQKAAREQAQEIAKKMNDAMKKKQLCLVKKGDYDSIANALDCSEANVCKGDRIGRLLTPLNALLHKSTKNPDASERNTISTEYNSCLRTARTATDPSSDDDKEEEAPAEETASERRERNNLRIQRRNRIRDDRKEYRATEGQACATTALGALDAKLEDSVNDAAKSTNSDIMGKIRAVVDACPDADAAVNACKAAQSKIKGLTPPDQLDTKVEDGGSSQNFTNPLTSGGTSAK
jgi:hypothetical protein